MTTLLFALFVVYCAAVFVAFRVSARRRFQRALLRVTPPSLAAYAQRGDPRADGARTFADAELPGDATGRSVVLSIDEDTLFLVPTSANRSLGEPSFAIPRERIVVLDAHRFQVDGEDVIVTSVLGHPVDLVLTQGPSAVTMRPSEWRSSEAVASDTFTVGSIVRPVHAAGAVFAILLTAMAAVRGHVPLSVGFAVAVFFVLGVSGRRFRHGAVTVTSAQQLREITVAELAIRAAVSTGPLVIAGVLALLIAKKSPILAAIGGAALGVGYSMIVSFVGIWRIRGVSRHDG